jgi:hypothetical protein
MYVLRQITHYGTLYKEKIIMATLAEIRAKLNAQENRTGSNQGGGDNAIFAHWNIPEGTTSRIRFLPDADSKNDFYWVERAMIRLPFNGIKGDVNSKPQIVQVPCVEMYGESCPILAEVRAWFKDSSLEEMGRKYWKKRSYLFQGFVRESSLNEDSTPENPIRRFIISPQIFNIVKAALMDPEMEELPTDLERGLDFNVVKTSKGGYADYSTSKYSRKESALTSIELAAMEQHGLHNLSDFLPKKPTDVELKIIHEMFEASVDGQAYDPDRWAAYYKPSGFTGSGNAKPVASAPTPTPVPTPTQSASNDADSDDAPVESAPATSAPATGSDSGKRAEDILAMIRNRQK